MLFEKFETIPGKNEIEFKKEKFKEIKREIDQIEDCLGKPIDEGIKETVVMFKAFELKTSGSCEGHFEEERIQAPYVEIYPTEPEEENWTENEELRNKVEQEAKEMRLKLLNLLKEFYEKERASFDEMLGFREIGYGFRIQSNGAEILEVLDEEERQENRLSAYKKEMEKFTEFLKEKYFQE